MRIPITRTVFDKADIQSVSRPLSEGWVSHGKYVREFEKNFARFVGTDDAVAVSSCTAGLHIALAALGVGPGDEVIVPAFTWISTANAAEHLGARAVLCDIQLETFNFDFNHLQSLITPKTKAIIAVHLFGLAADMADLKKIAAEKQIPVVEDAACALGTYQGNTHVGLDGDLGVFSFHPRKAITTGEGGMVISRNKTLLEKVRRLRSHGIHASNPNSCLLGDIDELGFNYRMTDLQGALGITQLDKAVPLIDRRRALALRYHEKLSNLASLRLPRVSGGRSHSFQSYVCLLASEPISPSTMELLGAKRDALIRNLEEAGVSTRQGTHALHLQTYYRKKYGLKPSDCPNAWVADRLSIALPLFPQLSESEQDFVVKCLREMVV